MTWIENLFKRKVGGSFVGNSLRTVAGLLTNGALGTGAGMITQKQSDIREMTDTDFVKKYGETKTGVKVLGVTPDPSIRSADQYWNDSGTKIGTSPMVIWNVISGWIPLIVIVIGTAWGLPKIIKAFK